MEPLALDLFGGFQAAIDGQIASGFATDKVRALLIYLAVESDRAHRRDFLAGLLWPELPNQDARRNLRKSLHRLREALGQSLSDQLLDVDRQSVGLNAQHLDLDLARLRDHLQQALKHDHSHLSACSECMSHLEAAMAIPNGGFLDGFYVKDSSEFDRWQSQHIELAAREVRQLLTLLVEAYESRQDFGQMLTVASHLVELDAFDEPAQMALIRAFALNGDRHEGLTQFDRYRDLLSDELDVAPGEAIQELYQRLQQDQLKPTAPPSIERHGFPNEMTRFFGRQNEIDQVLDRIADPDCRLLSLIGPGGIGKTRLSSEVAKRVSEQARDFVDGIYFVPLSSVQQPERIAPAVATSLGLELRGSASPQAQVLSALRERQLLLVFDNMEHLLLDIREAAEVGLESGSVYQESPDGGNTAIEFVTDMLERAPGITVLVSSREPLNLVSEWRIYLDGLDYPAKHAGGAAAAGPAEAVELFQHLADRLDPVHGACEDPEVISEICRLVEGSPLALEIAASWTRFHTCEQIVTEINRSLDFMTAPYRDMPVRHRSMRAVFEYSWQLLSVEEQQALAQLSVCQGGFSAQAAFAIAQVVSVELAGLAEKALVQRPTRGRFSLHELLRQFLAEKLGSADLTDTAHSRHGRYFLDFLSQQAASMQGDAFESGRDAIHDDIDNIRAAWRWGLKNRYVEGLDGGVEGLMRFFAYVGLPHERLSLAAESLSSLEAYPLDPAHDLAWAGKIRYTLLYFQSNTYGMIGKLSDALGPAEAAVEQAKILESAGALVESLGLLGHLRRDLGQYDQALELETAALDVAHEAEDQQKMAMLRLRLGALSTNMRRFEEAFSHYLQAHEIYKSLRSLGGQSDALGGLGIVSDYQHNFEQAISYYQKALEISRGQKHTETTIRHLANMSTSLIHLGQLDQAHQILDEAVALQDETGLRAARGLCLSMLGFIHGLRGEMIPSLDYYDGAIAFCREAGRREQLSESLLGKAKLMFDLGQLTSAGTLLDEARSLALELNANHISHRIELLQARLEHAGGDPEAGLAQLDALLTRLDHPLYRGEALDVRYEMSGDPADLDIVIEYFENMVQRWGNPLHAARLDALKGK
jgi:DNA-binding SARP family transcriptional activator/predicted ATPase